MNIYERLVKHFKGQMKTASALGVEQGTVSGWVRGKHGMSPLTALRAEQLTAGQFKATDLCPSLRSVNQRPNPAITYSPTHRKGATETISRLYEWKTS